MGFNCGIIGLPNVGKSTLFNALTQSNIAEAANYPFATIEPNIGRVAVPDDRLDKLAIIGKSEKIIPSKGWVLKTVIGVKTVAEWCTLCNDHKIGHLCIKRWTIYLLKSSIVNWKVVNEIITKIGIVLLNIPTLNQSIVCK